MIEYNIDTNILRIAGNKEGWREQSSLMPKELDAVIKMLDENKHILPYITSVNLENISIDSQITLICETLLRVAPQLTAFGIIHCTFIDNTGLNTLTDFLASLPNLIKLNLKRTEMYAKENLAIAKLISGNTLHELNLSKTDFTCYANSDLLKNAITQCTSLRVLNYENLRVEEMDFTALKQLEEINLNGCDGFYDNDRKNNPHATRIIKSLRNKNLTVIRLAEMNFSAHAELLAELITNCKNLHTIDLSYCEISATGMRTIANALKSNDQLREFSLCKINEAFKHDLPDAYNEAIVDILNANPNIRYLDLTVDQYLHGKKLDVKKISTTFPQLKHLETLKLAGGYNPRAGNTLYNLDISLEDMKVVLKNISTLKSLRVLDLSGNRLLSNDKYSVGNTNIDSIAQHVEKMLANLTTLTSLNLSYCGLNIPYDYNIANNFLDRGYKQPDNEDVTWVVVRLHPQKIVIINLNNIQQLRSIAGIKFPLSLKNIQLEGNTVDDDGIVFVVEKNEEIQVIIDIDNDPIKNQSSGMNYLEKKYPTGQVPTLFELSFFALRKQAVVVGEEKSLTINLEKAVESYYTS